MKNLFYSIFIFLSPQANAQFWQRITDFPSSERDDGISFVIDHVAYCGTGLNAGFSACGDFYALDMQTDNWTAVSSLPAFEERQYAVGFSYQDEGYLLGGINGSSNLNDIWKYIPALNSWTFIDTFPFTGRNGSTSFLIDSIAYLVGGRTSSNLAINEVWAYNILQNTWLQKNNLPFGERWRASACSINNKGYLLFGKDNEDKFTNSVFEYDALLDTWTLISNFPEPSMAYVSAQVVNNNIVIIGGLDSLGNSSNKMIQYKIAENVWQNLENIPGDGRRGGMCFSNANSIYYTAGINQNNIRIKETWKSDNPTSVKKNENKIDCLLFPNPVKSSEFVNVYFGDFSKKIRNVMIYNVNGTLLKEFSFTADLKQQLQLNFKNEFPCGIYYLKISGLDFNKILKFTVID